MNSEQLSKFGDFCKSLVLVASVFATLVGAFCLFIYSAEIRQFPKGVESGEGLAFYMVSLGFSLIYLFFVLGITAVGSVVFYWPLQAVTSWLLRRCRRRNPKIRLLGQELRPMASPTAIAIAIVAVLSALLLGVRRSLPWVDLAIVAALQASLVFVYLCMKRDVLLRETGLLDSGGNPMGPTVPTNVQYSIWLAIGVAPLLFFAYTNNLVTSAFTLAQLRKENATVHVKRPWSIGLVRSGLASEPSYFGTDYCRFRGVLVLLKSVGSNVVVELPALAMTPRASMSIPASDIHVE